MHTHIAQDASSPKGASTAVVANSDVEEGEIFSDDEEAAYFPQLVKSRSSENHSQERESQEGERDRSEREKESDGSESEAVEERRSGEKRKFRFDYSASPERDSYVPRWKRPKERDKSTKATSLASLFFEDRDGTRSEQSDDSRDTRERRSDQFHSSSSRHSHGYTSSKHSRERDRDRDRDRDSADRDRDRKDRSSSYYRHEKESRRSRDRDRERERDQDSTVDSSDEELPWSRHSHTSRYQSHQKGRRSANTHQLKYGQKQERFSGTTGESRGGGGRQGSREISQQSNWGPSPGVMNTGMTAQQFNALAERVRKRREKGLPLLPTPKIKPGDNLDQFNYPAPPSWYLEALEKWDEAQKERMLVDSREKAGVESSSFLEPGSYDMQEPSGAPTYNTEPQMVPQPLFKHDPLNVHGVGSLVSTLMPPIPLMPAQEPSPNPPPIIIHGQPNVIIPVNEPPISLFPGGYLVPKVAENEGPNFKNEERTNERTDPVIINPVVCSISTDAQVLDDEDDAEGVGMKIAVETPTPQADATTKFFQPTSENDTVNNEADPVPMATNELLESDAGKAPEVAENMDIDEPCESTEDTGLKSPSSPVIPQEAESQDSSVPSLSSPPVKSDPSSLATSTSPTSVAIPIAPGNTSVAAPATNQPTTSPDFGGHGTTTSVDTNPTTATGGAPLIHPLTKDFETMDEDSSQEEENENSMESDEDDFDYDKYLDQLDEEEEEEGEVKEKAPISSVMGSLASDLLLNNPLDEDFPTINPANEPSQKKEESISLKSLVGGTSCTMDDAENDTNVLSKTKGMYSILDTCIHMYV